MKVVVVCGGGGGAHLKFCSGDTVKVVVPFIEKSMKEEKETNYKENNKAHLKGDKTQRRERKNILTTTTIGCRDFFYQLL